jgi:cation diffusion facilitator family transporter
MSHDSGSLRSIFLALGANLVIAIIKLAAALATGSGSMMAEAVHSFADTGNQCLLLLGMKRARKPPSPDYPLGWGKATYFWSFIVAVMLFSLGGLFSVYEGIHKLGAREPLDRPWLALVILGASIVLEGISFVGCLREIDKVRCGKSITRWFRESRRSELIVVFGEDLAALVGLGLASVAVILTMVTKDPLYDALGSMAIGTLLILVALAVGREIKSLLIGESVDPRTRDEMRSFVAGEEGVRRVIDMITLQLGPDVMVAVKAEMEAADAREMIDAINAVEKRIKERFPEVRWVFFEPDVE